MNTPKNTPRNRGNIIKNFPNTTAAVALVVQSCIAQTASAHESHTPSVDEIRAYNARCEDLRTQTQGRADCNDYFVSQEVMQEVRDDSHSQRVDPVRSLMEGYRVPSMSE